jgi:hypothetical protein
MTVISTTLNRPRARRQQRRRGHLAPVAVGLLFAASAAALVAYLLWPTWQSRAAGSPDRIPVSVGDTLFNVPAHAFRRKVQKHSGPQERVDLSYIYPSLEASDVPRHVSLESFDEHAQPIDRIFVSILAHHDAMAPELRLRTIYPRYFEMAVAPAQDGLTMRAFRDGSAYSKEDLFLGREPELVARCTRDGRTPGMCLSERRIDGADLTFRFPRAWLSDWRTVGAAIDTLTAQLGSPKG